jgi:hypothetical protein
MTTPTITSINSAIAKPGLFGASDEIVYSLGMSEIVTVAGGTPTLALDDGGTANYASGSGTNTLTFNYAPATPKTAPLPKVTAVNLGSATIDDSAGSAANLSLASLNQGSATPIKPGKIAAVGQIVYFYPDLKQARGMKSIDNTQPFAAIVASSDPNGRLVNIVAIDHKGSIFPCMAVPMFQGDEHDDKKARSHCEFDLRVLEIGSIATLGSITGGASYVSGVYKGVPLTGGSGTGATADITVANGIVTAAVMVARGVGYEVGDVLSVSNTNLGGAGSGFTVPVATVVPVAPAAPIAVAA